MTFKYLRANVTSNRKLKEKVQVQMTKIVMMSGYLRYNMEKYISLKSKIKIYRTYVRFIMIYTTETRAETTITKYLLRRKWKLQDALLATFCGIGFITKIHNNPQYLRHSKDHKIGQNKIESEDKHYVNKMDDNGIAKIAKNGKPMERPLKCWCKDLTSISQENRH